MKVLPMCAADVLEQTIPALLAANARRRGPEAAFHQKRGGVWSSTSWNQYAGRVVAISRGLVRLGLQRGDRVGIMGDVSQEWLLADMATMCSGAITVGIYFTSSPEEIDYYITDSGAKIVFVGGSDQLKLLLAGREASKLDAVIVMDPAWDGTRSLDSIRKFAEFAGNEDDVLHFLDEQAGLAVPTDIASIGYTSGTTGSPKGAMLSHRSLLAGAYTHITFCPPLGQEPQRIVVHLPFSHTVARGQGTTFPLISNSVPYFGETTSDFSATIMEVKPTYYMAPPRFYQRAASTLIGTVQKWSISSQQDYQFAMRVAKKTLSARQADASSEFLEELYAICRERIFKPLLATIGFDQLANPYTASAPMPPEVMTLWQLWGLQLRECYGQTEMVGGNTSQMESWPKSGTIGIPLLDPSWETKILSDGEMIVRGPGLFVGYWNKPEETASALRDGWLYTGDIVELQKNGHLKLVDRKKEIINTSGGKSISPTQIENELRDSQYISEAAVIGDGRKYLTALIEVDATSVMNWVKSRDSNVSSYGDLAQSEVVIRLIEGEVAKANAKLARVEQIKAFRILPEELSPDNGVMTPTRKKKRKPLMERYKTLIDSLYDDSEEIMIKRQVASGG